MPAELPGRRSTSRATSPWRRIGKYKDAIALIKENNPLPSVCGRVCTRPCEVKGCRRNLLDEAVGIDYIKRYISDLDLNSPDVYRPAAAPANGRRVAVVGAGPAGLSAAYYLALKGYGVQIFEGQPEPGGMLRYGIPEYRLPKDVLDLEIAQILDLGREAEDQRRPRQGLHDRQPEAATASRRSSSASAPGDSSLMRVQNETAEGVLSGIEFLKNFGLRKKIDIHGTVAVVGRRQHRHRLRPHGAAPRRRRGEAALPPHPRRDAGQRLRDRRRDRGGREDGVPGRADARSSPTRTGA